MQNSQNIDLHSACKKSQMPDKKQVYKLSGAKSLFSKLVNQTVEAHGHLKANNSGNPQSRYWQEEEFSDKHNAEIGIFLLKQYNVSGKSFPELAREMKRPNYRIYQNRLKMINNR